MSKSGYRSRKSRTLEKQEVMHFCPPKPGSTVCRQICQVRLSTITRAMSILEIQGYNTNEGVLGFIAMPTFIPFSLIWVINFSISSSEDNASMWKQYRSESVG